MTLKFNNEPIKSFRGRYWAFSSFYPRSIVYKDTLYKCLEYAYQAAKTDVEEEKLMIMSAETAGIAKRLGREVTIRPRWDEERVPVMRDLVIIKFAYPDLMEILQSTHGQVLIEGNTWHDLFWGKCYCSRHNGEGQNMLGQLLMELRG